MKLSVYHTAANKLRTTRIVSLKTESPTVRTFAFKDKECARAKPGQFLMLWIPGIDEIPLSILGVDKNDVVSVAVKIVGEATQALHCKKRGDIVGLRGPLGNSFTTDGQKLLMVGGGTGVAPLLFLIKTLAPRRIQTTFVLGARTKDELLFRRELMKFGNAQVKLVASTEDGSCGLAGLCTDLVEEILSRERFDMVCSCGPEQMIFKVFELAETHGMNLQASLERLMRCAIGLCGSCTIGRYRVCADGPVFTSKQLREVKEEFGFLKRDAYGKRVPIA